MCTGEELCNIKKYTMRSAFKRWCILHNEEFRTHGYIRIPNWFRHYIRQTTQWMYIVSDPHQAYYCNKRELTLNERRRFKGNYVLEISDGALVTLERPKWHKDVHSTATLQRTLDVSETEDWLKWRTEMYNKYERFCSKDDV